MRPATGKTFSEAAMEVQPQQVHQLEEDDDLELREFIKNPVHETPMMDNFVDDPIASMCEEIEKHIKQLKHGDLSKRVDSLVSLNEMILNQEQYKEGLVRSANEIISAMTHVMIDIFDKEIEEIPLRFAKYFITISVRLTQTKDIMRAISEENVFNYSEQLLLRLLIENLDKIGENKEGEFILKNLNSCVLRALENCNHTDILVVLFQLLKKYKDYGKLPKLAALIVKCILKLSKIIDKIIDKLDLEKVLVAIHELIIDIPAEART